MFLLLTALISSPSIGLNWVIYLHQFIMKAFLINLVFSISSYLQYYLILTVLIMLWFHWPLFDCFQRYFLFTSFVYLNSFSEIKEAFFICSFEELSAFLATYSFLMLSYSVFQAFHSLFVILLFRIEEDVFS